MSKPNTIGCSSVPPKTVTALVILQLRGVEELNSQMVSENKMSEEVA